MNEFEPVPQPPRSTVQQLGAVLWPSFFAAVIAAAVFFSLVDPLKLGAVSFPEYAISRERGYTVGFLLLWLATASASAVTALLLRPRRGENDEGPLE
ncbi:hypothetical protein [Stenotrophomonas sp. SY1]|jgi:hypothetical protein|uniref:hypothetical protein n=1 Tax=Stenotrophomonas sp. SY1 TaxID=477235 RepID=UPI001E412CE7|nr:hypothetical protein [Stenotrophomonas sp. SY1]MCD9088744.1 hypothetical protein [Stenotrophomonas sp. SY1]